MGNELGTEEGTPAFTSVTDSIIMGWANLTAYIQNGHWWREDARLNTANKDITADIQLLASNENVSMFKATIDTSSCQLYEPIAAQMYFSQTGTGAYRYAGIRTKLVAVEDNGETVLRQLLLVEIGTNTGVLESFETILDETQQVFNLEIAIDNLMGNSPATLTWDAGTFGGSISTEFGAPQPGKAGFLTTKTGGYGARFNNVLIAAGTTIYNSVLVSPIYQYTTYKGKGCIWDNNGNLKLFGSDQFSYDAFNRMTKANGVRYLYDSQNRRIAKIDGGITTYYVYHGWSVIAEYDGSGNLLREYVEGISTDEHLCMIDASGTKYYYILDSRNGVDRMVDVSGNTVDSYTYSAYGEILTGDVGETSYTGNSYAFQGRRYDEESDLMYFRNRMYSPEMKRFVSMDPLGQTLRGHW